MEIINAFYTIKLHCWERFFEEKTMENREHEIKFVKTTMFLKLLNTAIGFIVTKMSVFLTLIMAFIFEKNGTIHPKRVFLTLILYEHVRVNFMILFPQAINDIAELLCSCRRIAAFLLMDELEPMLHMNSDLSNDTTVGKDSAGIEVSNMSCKWFPDDKKGFELKDINLKVLPGQLVVVAGLVYKT